MHLLSKEEKVTSHNQASWRLNPPRKALPRVTSPEEERAPSKQEAYMHSCDTYSTKPSQACHVAQCYSARATRRPIYVCTSAAKRNNANTTQQTSQLYRVALLNNTTDQMHPCAELYMHPCAE